MFIERNGIEKNPADKRLKYVWDQSKPKPSPKVMLDLIGIVSQHVGADHWADAVDKALIHLRHSATDHEEAGLVMDASAELDSYRHDKGTFSTASMQKLADVAVQTVTGMPAFQKKAAIDGMIPWMAKELVRLDKSTETDAHDYAQAAEREYGKFLRALSQPLSVEWFEKKKPQLSKLDAHEALDAIAAFEGDREPEVVHEWDDGWKIVKLMTPTQIDREGVAMVNCLRGDSSYHEGFCKAAASGKDAFYSLRDKTGKSRVSIQWPKGSKDPQQVYGPNNEELDSDSTESEKVDEWVKERGGEGLDPLRGLSRSAREIAELLLEQGHDREYVRDDAEQWDNDFSLSNALAWIRNGVDREMAGRLEGEKIDPDDYESLPPFVSYYLQERYDSFDKEVPIIGLLAGEFSQVKPQEVLSLSELRQTDMDYLWQKAEYEEPKRKAKTIEPLPKGMDVDPGGDEAWMWRQAKAYYDDGWDDKDYYHEAAKWWAARFNGHDSHIYVFGLSDLDKRSDGVSLENAAALRSQGYSAEEVEQAARAFPGTPDTQHLEGLLALMEWRKVNPNLKRNGRLNDIADEVARRLAPIIGEGLAREAANNAAGIIGYEHATMSPVEAVRDVLMQRLKHAKTYGAESLTPALVDEALAALRGMTVKPNRRSSRRRSSRR